ncbi:copper chaperone PCu(A)C [Kineococcus sp. R86509]|uniref:copper chaperone PCu(A)C n=1 Tax=Kineococcus sp. R86509 TaxID=3093851 RepID=UPI0036D29F1E
MTSTTNTTATFPAPMTTDTTGITSAAGHLAGSRTGGLRRRRRLTLAAAPLIALAALTACSGGQASGSQTASPATSSSSSTGSGEATALTVSDPWVKAADTGMTAAFGTLTNTGEEDVHIVSATTAASSSMELHEMATDDSGAMVMREKPDGFIVPAGGTHELSPGGDHLMLMSVTAPVLPGQDVDITLTAEDGSTFNLLAPARSFSGANESYDDGDDSTGHEGMDGMEGMHDMEGMPDMATPATTVAP